MNRRRPKPDGSDLGAMSVVLIGPMLAYPREQLRKAAAVALQMGRGALVLTEPPPHRCDIAAEDHGQICPWCCRKVES